MQNPLDSSVGYRLPQNDKQNNSCHTERSEVSKNQYEYLQNPLDSSVGYRLPQNDKQNNSCHTERSEVSQPNATESRDISLNAQYDNTTLQWQELRRGFVE